MKMPTIVYIDGFNLYYGLLRHSPHKWLDLVKFVEALLTDKYTGKVSFRATVSFSTAPRSLCGAAANASR